MKAAISCYFLLIAGLAPQAHGQAQDNLSRANLEYLTARVTCASSGIAIATATVVGYGHSFAGAAHDVRGNIYLATVGPDHLKQGCSPKDLRINFPDIAGRNKIKASLAIAPLAANQKQDFQLWAVQDSDDYPLAWMDADFGLTAAGPRASSRWCVTGDTSTLHSLSVLAYPPDSNGAGGLSQAAEALRFVDRKDGYLRYSSEVKLPVEGDSGGVVIDPQGAIVGIHRGRDGAFGLGIPIETVKDFSTNVPWMLTPIKSSDPAEVTESISAGWNHTCRLAMDGTAYCWGQSKALGIGTDRSVRPQKVKTDLKFLEISAGYDHTCAIARNAGASQREAGNAYCWGDNQFGQLGVTSTTKTSEKPIPVAGQARFLSLVTGRYFTCGIKDDRSVACWGKLSPMTSTRNSGGAMAPVAGLPALAQQISAGEYHVCGVVQGGVAYCWGDPWDGEWTDAHPIRANGKDFASVTADRYIGYPHTRLYGGDTGGACGVTSKKEVWCWKPYSSEPHSSIAENAAWAAADPEGLFVLGTDGRLSYNRTASKVLQFNVRDISMGHEHGCLVDACGHPYCWGNNGSDALGTGELSNDRPLPVLPDIIH